MLSSVTVAETRRDRIYSGPVKITMSPDYSYMVETKVINGRKYILIPADDGMEVNGVAVEIRAE